MMSESQMLAYQKELEETAMNNVIQKLIDDALEALAKRPNGRYLKLMEDLERELDKIGVKPENVWFEQGKSQILPVLRIKHGEGISGCNEMEDK